jgi:hypothetical protein
MSGLFDKYQVTHADGRPVDPNARYFVLRLDTDQPARAAAAIYADAVEESKPDLAADLRSQVAELGAGDDFVPMHLQTRTVKSIEDLPDGGVHVLFDCTPHQLGVTVTAAQLAMLRGYMVGLTLAPKYSQEYADARVLSYLVDAERGTPPGAFLGRLIDAMQQADPDNLERLRVAFPTFVEAVVRWREGELR